jgi:hypothetical protein
MASSTVLVLGHLPGHIIPPLQFEMINIPMSDAYRKRSVNLTGLSGVLHLTLAIFKLRLF